MAMEMIQVAWEAMLIMLDPVRMGFLFGGVLIGLLAGGIGIVTRGRDTL